MSNRVFPLCSARFLSRRGHPRADRPLGPLRDRLRRPEPGDARRRQVRLRHHRRRPRHIAGRARISTEIEPLGWPVNLRGLFSYQPVNLSLCLPPYNI